MAAVDHEGFVTNADAPATGEFDVSPKDCRAQLSRILNSRDFEATPRERRFLSHIVEETITGRASRIKAYSIAVEVFGRDANFDPQQDPIVRMEAGHLRRSLERYYFTAGKDDPVLITIPKGGYVPAFSPRLLTESAEAALQIARVEHLRTPFSWRNPSWLTVALGALVAGLVVLAFSPPTTGPNPTTPEIPRLLVERFDDLTGTEASAAIASGLTHEVVGQLSKFKNIVVVQAKESPTDATASPARFALSGSVNLSADTFRLWATFTNRADGSVLWAESFDGDLTVAKVLQAQVDIASRVSTSLAQTYGVIFQADTALKLDNAPDDWSAYSCTLSFYRYRAELNPGDRNTVRTCLEQAVKRFPRYATAWGLLSMIYIDDYRFQPPLVVPAASSPAIQKAFSAARRAVELDPLNVRGRQGEMFALFFTKEIDAALKVGKDALAINPNDTELMFEYGDRLALSGNWSEGCSLIKEALSRNPSAFGYFQANLALCAYFQGDFPEAATWIKNAPIVASPVYHLMAAAILGTGGYEDEARRESEWLQTNAPAMTENLKLEISTRLVRPKDIDFFAAGLKAAGLKLSD